MEESSGVRLGVEVMGVRKDGVQASVWDKAIVASQGLVV